MYVGCSLCVALGRSCPFLQQTKNDGGKSSQPLNYSDRIHSFSHRFLSLVLECLAVFRNSSMGIIWPKFIGKVLSHCNTAQRKGHARL